MLQYDKVDIRSQSCHFVFQVFNSLCEIKPDYAKCEIKRNIVELLLSPTNQTVNAIEIGKGNDDNHMAINPKNIFLPCLL